MKRENKVYIIGHKNPDTDSICSAIAYADIKNRTEKGTFVAKRAGQINEETEYVLKRFGVRAPGYLSDAGTQVREIEIHEVKGVPGNHFREKGLGIHERAECGHPSHHYGG